jgi:hypothetical protein
MDEATTILDIGVKEGKGRPETMQRKEGRVGQINAGLVRITLNF